ncbi:lysophospholipid acyltransferase family protein [Polyangium aurulentum]|uniref:lysophospholipid acyltransferase family protein n=1 Tax=Polyangium aurulentum TaxID=2567896 RepID=UPI0010AE3BB2|nr:DUF374 domain-containing protein [Polyangium aurulentum]UQA60794.1 DUF374 domain-containing protein [Polyangium aurulentum]
MKRTARRALGASAGLVARAFLATLRLSLVTHPDLASAGDKPWVLAFWHGQQFALHRWKRRRKIAVLVSLSDDGELQAAALRRIGLVVERGSSSRQGASGLKGIVRRMRAGCDAAFAVDGPRGPRGVVRGEGDRAGAILSARIARGVVVPMASACASAWVFDKAWDRFELPRPFSRVAVALGPPLDPHSLDGVTLARHIDEARARALGALRVP